MPQLSTSHCDETHTWENTSIAMLRWHVLQAICNIFQKPITGGWCLKQYTFPWNQCLCITTTWRLIFVICVWILIYVMDWECSQYLVKFIWSALVPCPLRHSYFRRSLRITNNESAQWSHIVATTLFRQKLNISYWYKNSYKVKCLIKIRQCWRNKDLCNVKSWNVQY